MLRTVYSPPPLDVFDTFLSKEGIDTGFVVGLTVFLSLAFIFMIAMATTCYHYKKKTKHYHNVTHWYKKKDKKVGITRLVKMFIREREKKK